MNVTGDPNARLLERIPQARAARYLAKYIAAVDPRGGKITLSETVTHPDVPGHLTYVNRRLTSETGCTMRSLRETRCNHMRVRRTIRDMTAPWARLVLAFHREQLLERQGATFVDELERQLGP